jgi:hypothetical protein
MTDELVEISGKSGPHVVWRPGTNGELVVAPPSGGLPFEAPYQDVKRWKPAGDEFQEFSPKGTSRRHESRTAKLSPRAGQKLTHVLTHFHTLCDVRYLLAIT